LVAHGLSDSTLGESLNKCVGKWVVGNDGGECLVALAAVSFFLTDAANQKIAGELTARCANPRSNISSAISITCRFGKKLWLNRLLIDGKPSPFFAWHCRC